MICPLCGFDNVPGSESCVRCQQDLTQFDVPVAQDRVQQSLMEDPVSILQPCAPVTVSPSSTLQEAIQAMLDHNIGAVLVTEGSQILGILTERDLLRKVVVGPRPDLTRSVSEVMTPRPETIAAHDTLAFALHKMDSGGYRHLPVMDTGHAMGMISVRDMLEHFFTRLCKN